MTPYQKAIEAAAKAAYEFRLNRINIEARWDNLPYELKNLCRSEATVILNTGLASARESGWELVPRNLPYEPIPDSPGHNEQQSRAQLIWRNMFDTHPRFEDAP
jgi:hypothetical protein